MAKLYFTETGKINVLKLMTAERTMRFISKIKETDSGCHEWQGSSNSRGYGILPCRVGNKVKHVQVHRIAYFLFNPDADQEKSISRKCGNLLCCNPLHLEPK